MGDQELFSAFIEGNVLLRVTKEDGSQFDVPAVMSGLKEENSLYSLDITTCGEPKWIRRKELKRHKTGIDINRCIRRLKKRRY